MYSRIFPYIFFVLLLLSETLYSKSLVIDSKFLIKNNLETTVLNKSEGLKFEINPSVAKEIFTTDFESLKINNFPSLGSASFNFTLEKAFIPFDQNTEFYRGTKDGLQRAKAPNLMTLSGRIDGQPNSFVFFSFSDYGIFGTIQEENGSVYSISPNITSNNLEHILASANVSVMDEKIIFSCLTEDYSGHQTEAEDLIQYYKDDVPLAKRPLLEVHLAVEGTSDYFKIFNNSQKALAYMASVIAQSSKLFQEYFNVRLYISYAVVWEDEWDDPYYGTKNLSEKLQKMPSIWRNKTIDRALTVLFANLANQPSNETVAGISYGGTPYYGSLCSKDWGYCVLGIRGNATYPTFNYTWDVNVATHEIGHNFSLPHTHNCYWQPNMIDTCVTGETYGVGDACIKTGSPIPRPGTIMSYCHLTNSTRSVQFIFHPREFPLARSAAERSSCVKQRTSPFISILNPLGDKTFVAGEELQIRWTSAYVNYLTIFFSSDKGNTWSVIADNVAATDSIFIWIPRNIKSNNCLIYIRDKGNPNVADTSMKTFSIIPKSIEILSPSPNEEYASGEAITLSWNASLVDTFNVYFSNDGGNKFQTLFLDFTKNFVEFTAPDVKSDNCIFKVTSKDGKIVAESPMFKIGTPSGVVLFPKGGEVFCANASYTIKWNASYINKIVLEYSTDLGISWRKVSLANLDAKLGSYIWKVPNRFSSQCLIRIRPTFNENTISVSDSVFSIDSCQVIGGVIGNHKSSMEIIKNCNFNSDKNELVIEFENLERISNPFISIFDVMGRTLYSESLNSNTINNNIKIIKISNVAKGILFVILNFEGGSKLISTVVAQ